MIPGIALMIAVYGSARLANDCLARDERSGATVVMWVISIGAVMALWILAFLVLVAGA